MDTYTDPYVETMVLMFCAQMSKSEFLNNICCYHIIVDPCPILMVQPTIVAGNAYFRERIIPMIRASPALAAKIPTSAERRSARAKASALDEDIGDESGATADYIPFPGGHLTVVGANSPVGISGRPIRALLFDEVDRAPRNVRREGDPVVIAMKRTSTFLNRKHVFTSTPTEKGTSRIEALFEASDKRYFKVPCPDCGTFQRLVWSQVQWPKGRPRDARYVCEHCGVGMTQTQKLKAIKQGYWERSRPEGLYPGFHLSEIYSPWKTLAEMAVEFLEASKNPETLRAWTNTSLGETFEDIGSQIDAKTVEGRLEDWGHLAPRDVLVVTCGVDVQADRVEIERVGWGVNEESWSLDYRIIHGDPSGLELWRDLDDYLRVPTVTEDSRVLPVKTTCIDSGGHNTSDVYKFVRDKTGRRIWAIKGQGGQGRPVWPLRASKANAGKVMLYMVGVDSAKDAIYRRLSIADHGPGYCHFPVGRDSEYFKQLTAEKRVTEWIKGFPRRVYIKNASSANEALDCRVYAYAALQSLQVSWQREATKAEKTPRIDIEQYRREVERAVVVAQSRSAAADATVERRAAETLTRQLETGDKRLLQILGRKTTKSPPRRS